MRIETVLNLMQYAHFSTICYLMMPKCSPVRCTILTLEQPLPEKKKKRTTRKHLQRGSGVGPVKYPPKVKSENAFTTLECYRGVSYTHIPFLRVLGPFYSGEVLPHFLVEQASQTC